MIYTGESCVPCALSAPLTVSSCQVYIYMQQCLLRKICLSFVPLNLQIGK